jgi:hypothetical protein
MDDYIDVLIANLKVIGSVPSGGRLAVRRGQLSVDTTIHGQFLVRFWYGDSRESTIQHVKNAVAGAVKTADSIMCAALDWKSVWTLSCLASEMESAEFGLRNLRSTYSADAGAMAALSVISERLHAHGMVIRSFIHPSANKKVGRDAGAHVRDLGS